MKRLSLAVLMFTVAAAQGCGKNDAAAPDAAVDGAAAAVGFALTQPCTDKVDDVYAVPSGLPAWDASHRGDVVRCAMERTIDAAALNAAVTANGYVGAALPSGVTVYRIAYRTQRVANQKGPSDGVSTALLFVPHKVVSPGALLVAAHGTVGLAPQCAPSRSDQTAAGSDAHTLNLALAGRGLVTIAPDYAGSGQEGGVYGWALSEDEAHSLLDATRAVKRLVPAAQAPQKVVVVGHSQGGHAALSTQALASSYGLEGSLVGAVAFAPLWLTGRTWGGVLSPIGMQNTTANASLLALQLLYFYGHGELYDGPGGGTVMFREAKRAQVKTNLTALCYGELTSSMRSLGDTPPDYFDAGFATRVGDCALGGDCTSDDAKRWRPRFTVDRPRLDPAGAPVVVLQGGADATIAPKYAQCGFDRMAADLPPGGHATLTLCGDAAATHGSVVERGIDWVGQWASARVGAGPEPAACKGISELGPLTCPPLPPNDD